MVTCTQNKYGKTENANANVNSYASRNYTFPSSPELIDIENNPYFELPPFPMYIPPLQQMSQQGLDNKVICVRKSRLSTDNSHDLYSESLTITPLENQRNMNENFQPEERMVALAPNQYGRTENTNENVNGYSSRNYRFPSPSKHINLENIPYFGEFPPIPNFIQPPPEMLQRGLLPNTIQIKPVDNPPFGYYNSPIRNNNMGFSTNVNSRNIRTTLL